MMPDWLAKPNAWFLLVFSPFLTLLVEGIIRRGLAWHASRSESTAKASLTYLYRAQAEPPPTLLESLGWIICFLPLPFAIASLLLFMHVAPTSPGPPIIDARLAQKIGDALLAVLFICTYIVFSLLTVHGVKLAYLLRHGQARYHEHYRAGIRKRIEKIKKKFPRLASQ
jgi:hypothetical protein